MSDSPRPLHRAYGTQPPLPLEQMADNLWRVRWDVKEEPVVEDLEGPSDPGYSWLEADVPDTEYAHIVSAIIGRYYSIDDQIAILSNAMAAGANPTDGNSPKYMTEMLEFQTVRLYAKSNATQAIEEYAQYQDQQ